MEIRYPAILEPQEPSGFLVRFPDMEDTFTEGETEEEALFNASEVLTGMLGYRLDHDQPIPEPSREVPGGHLVAPDAKTQAALLVRWTRGERTVAGLARALETSWPAVQRLENPHHWPTLKQLDRAVAAMGGKLVLVVVK